MLIFCVILVLVIYMEKILLVDGNNIRVVNSAVYAMMRLQEQLKGEADKAGFLTEEDVAKWITHSRREESAE